MTTQTPIEQQQTTRDKVREGYKQIALQGLACCGPKDEPALGGGCCGTDGKSNINVDDLAAKLGYQREQIEQLPQGANMGLSCGNPTAIAALTPGQVVVDLGSGGGFDCFLAGPKVGATGRVIGIDMTAEMLAKARRNTASYTKATGLDNVEFRLGEIEHLPLPDASVDVIISNCVINLSPDKPRVWREIARVLKPGGKVAVSDMALLKPLPDDVLNMVAALVGCIAGAEVVDDYRRTIEATGLTNIQLTPKPDYVRALLDTSDPLYARIAQSLPDGAPEQYITSLDVTATKAGTCCGPSCCK
jgi:SAM-dependent methyltransferase